MIHGTTDGKPRVSRIINHAREYEPLNITIETDQEQDSDEDIRLQKRGQIGTLFSATHHGESRLKLDTDTTAHPRYSSPQLTLRPPLTLRIDDGATLQPPSFLQTAERLRINDDSSESSSDEQTSVVPVVNEEEKEDPYEAQVALLAHDSDDDTDTEMEAPVAAAAEIPHDAHAKFWLILTIMTKIIVSLIASGANAINAMMNPSDKQPKDINSEWWENLSTRDRTEAIWFAVASLLVNFILAYDSIPEAFHTLKTSVTKPHKTRQEKFDLGVTVTLGLSAAVASSAISFGAFTWLNTTVAKIVAFAALLINFTTRYVGVKNLGNRVRSGYDSDTQAIHQFIRDMNNIKRRYRNITDMLVKQSYDRAGNKINDKTIAYFANRMFILRRIIEEKNDNIIHTNNRLDIAWHYLLLGLTGSLASIVGLASLPTFDQKGFDGLNAITGGYLKFLPAGARGFIGFPPGAATAMLYAVSALDLPNLTVNTAKDLWHDRDGIKFLFFLFLGIANVYASSSMENVSKGAMQSPDWIFSFLVLGTFLGKTVVNLNRVGGGATNTKASFLKFFSAPAPRDGRLRDVIKYLEKKDITTRLSTKSQALVNRWHSNPTRPVEEVKPASTYEIDVAEESRRHRHDTEHSDNEANSLIVPRARRSM
jgi:hypothetical protein